MFQHRSFAVLARAVRSLPGRRTMILAVVLALGLGVTGTGLVQIARPAVAAEPVPEGLSAGDWSQIRAAVSADAYRAVAREAGGYAAANPDNGYEARFGAEGFSLGSDADGWRLPVRFAGHGWRGGDLIPAKAAEAIRTGRGDRVEFRRGEVVEWYVNRPTGVEQGFTVARAPEGSGRMLEVAMDIGGGFTARPNRDGALLTEARTGTEIAYDKLVVVDARGRTLSSRMQVAERRIVLSVDTRGAAFPIVIDPTFTQQAKLVAADRASNDYFGQVVAVSGDTAVIGAPQEDSSGTVDNGAAYVFVRTGTTWTQQAKLLAADKASNDQFGVSVAISGDTVVIGARWKDDSGTTDNGAAYVFVRTGTTWNPQAKLLALDKAEEDQFGESVAISGETVMVGTTRTSDSGTTGNGAVYVFTRAGATWTQQTKLLAADKENYERFGRSIAIAGDTAVFGAYGESDSGTSNNGAAYVFVRAGGTWTEQAKLLASDKGDEDFFGWSVAVSGDTAVIGAHQHDGGGLSNSGAAYVFVRSGATWTQRAKLLAADRTTDDLFGHSVALMGDTALIGAHLADDGATEYSGVVYVFPRTGSVWTQQAKLAAADKARLEAFGYSVAVSGDTVMIGAVYEGEIGMNRSGAAYVFNLAPEAVPTLSEWAMILLGVLMTGGAVIALNRRPILA